MRKLKIFLDHLQNNNDPQTVIFSENGIFKRKLKSGLTVIMVPLLLIPFVLAEAHWMSHFGAKKLPNIIRLQYWWKNMRFDIEEFVKGCIQYRS